MEKIKSRRIFPRIFSELTQVQLHSAAIAKTQKQVNMCAFLQVMEEKQQRPAGPPHLLLLCWKCELAAAVNASSSSRVHTAQSPWDHSFHGSFRWMLSCSWTLSRDMHSEDRVVSQPSLQRVDHRSFVVSVWLTSFDMVGNRLIEISR